jgi:phenylpropionate dioxygenase-like ring-hydroxylating dioxygenase large terminal subunit
VARRRVALQQRQLPKHGAIWLTYYPNIMVEWYPHVLCISTLHPWARARRATSSSSTTPRKSPLFEREFVEAERAAYMETCVEDDEIAERMDAGRLALMKRGVSEVGPYQSRWKTACSTSTSGTAARWTTAALTGVR